MKEYTDKAHVLIEALPYIRKFQGSTFVIKYGGNVMISRTAQKSTMTDIVLLKHVGIHPVVVHGGGPEASRLMEEAGIKPEFVKGLRVTDDATLDIVRQALSIINERICDYIGRAGGNPIGLIAVKNVVFIAKQRNKRLGYVGDIEQVDYRVVQALIDSGYIPIIAPLGTDKNGQMYNINADTAATALACSLKARKLTFMTNVSGVMEEDRKISKLTVRGAQHFIEEGVVTGGMIPKLEACIEAIQQGVKNAHLIEGTLEHSLLLEIFTHKGIGTMVLP